jgi:hypothetical protein
MSIPSYIERSTDQRSDSIYRRFQTAHDARSMAELFNSPELPLSLKFSAALAAFAHFCFPLQLSAFRSLIPDSAWRDYFHFRYTSGIAGYVPIFWGENEWFYALCIGPRSSPYGLHIIYFVASSSIMPGVDHPDGDFDPPLNSSIVRFTLCHPFLQHELHDPTGIYLFKSA